MTSSDNLLSIIESFADQKLLIIGEAMLDSFLEGTSERLSQEAPVPIVDISQRVYLPGGAANTAVNVCSLGAEAMFLSAIGGDAEGQILLTSLAERGVSTTDVLTVAHRHTLAKQRIVAGSQILVRFDQGSSSPIDPQTELELMARLDLLFPTCDVIIISDYNYGVLTPRIIQTLEELQKKYPRLIILDSKRPQDYRTVNVTVVKPNYEEAVHLLALEKMESGAERLCQMETHGRRVLDLTGASIAAITLDQQGALIFHRDDEAPYRTYAKAQSHSHATGAGDTFVSVLAASLAAGADLEHAAELASAACAIVVTKDGTAACFADELRDHFLAHEKFVNDVFHLAMRVAHYHRTGQKIVFTNGCFDILHRGHIAYLNRAKALGDILIIGLNSDGSVRAIKGPDRPINSLEDRAQVLAALSCVDHIVPFDSETPHDLIRAIQPDVFAKGGDYTLETLPEASLVEELGGKVEILPYLSDHSTTSVIEKILGIFLEKSHVHR